MKISSWVKLGASQLINQGLEYVSYHLNRTLNIPTRFSLAITYRCNLRCLHCDVWRKKYPPPGISPNDKIKILGKIKSWVGPFLVNFYGGEPYLKPEEMDKLCKFCRENNIITGTNSNGYVIDRKMAKEIARSGLNTIVISLDGFKPEIHNYLRGASDSYERAVSALSYLNEYRDKMEVGITTVLMDYNMEEILPLVVFANKMDVRISLQPLQPNFDAKFDPQWYKKSQLWPKDSERINQIIDEIIKMKKDGFPIRNTLAELQNYKGYFELPDFSATEEKCYVGVRNFIVDPYGQCQLCYEMEPIGNADQKELNNIWKSDVAHKQRRRIKNCKLPCRILGCNRKKPLWHQAATFFKCIGT